MSATSVRFASTRQIAFRGPARRNHIAVMLMLTLAVLAPRADALAPGADGVRVTIPVSGTDDTAFAAAVDPAGNVVMAGATSSGSSALAGITRTGQLNTAFGTANGVVLYNLSTSTDTLTAIVRMADGRYVGCGVYFTPGTGNDFFTARFMSDGSLDTTFDGSGYAVTPFLPSGAGGQLVDQCNAVVAQSDGMIVSAGFTAEQGPDHVALTRHTASGQLDTLFGSGGLVDINASATSNGNSHANALLVQPDGKLLVAGYAGGTGNTDMLVMRLNGDGSPDAAFGTGGITRTPVGTGEDIANAMVLQPDGRIVIAGSSVAADGRRDFALARYMSDGTLDPSFGTGGLVTTPVGPGDDIAFALTLMPWGRLIAAGSARISTSASGTDLALISYNADGSIDRYFGMDGKVMLDVSGVSSAQDTVYALANDIDGEHFWAIGTAEPTTSQDFLAVEFGLDDTIFRHGFDTNTAP